jgi:hypothetical protein
MPPMLADLTLADFSGRVGETFRFTSPGAGFELTLAEVTDLSRPEAPGRGRKPFSLIFRGPVRPVLAQRIWPLEHLELGQLEIFLVPIGPDAQGMRYEAIFN